MKRQIAHSLRCLTAFIAGCMFLTPHAMGQATYYVVRTVPLGGDGGWDFLYADSGTHRLYIARATRFMVVDLTSGKLVGEIPDTPGAHGVAVVPDLDIGFTRNGRENMSSVFDLQTLKVSHERSEQKFSVIDPKTRKVVATIALSGKPEAPVPDGKGHLYTNIEDNNSIAVVDSASNTVIAEWPLPGCDEPTGVDMDREEGHLFAACGNKLMAIVDSTTTKVIASISTGDESDGLAFDRKARVAVTSTERAI